MVEHISNDDVLRALQNDNPWWELDRVPEAVQALTPRLQFEQIYRFWQGDVRRAIVLFGPRRVGKTIILQQCVDRALADKVDAKAILYIAADNPAYGFSTLQRLFNLFRDTFEHSRHARLYVLIDEIQYVKNWERYLKSLVDTFQECRFIVSGSAAAALRKKSAESGAGRFADWLLPPLTFLEYLVLRGETKIVSFKPGSGGFFTPPPSRPINRLNEHFIDYLNFGGFPEIVANPQMHRSTADRVGRDIIDKVLLKDLPSIFGIDDPIELNRFFAMLAYHSGREFRLEDLAQQSGLAKNTIKKYCDFLEAAFLVRRLYRLDQDARTMQRQTSFKMYLTTPSLRAAIWGALDSDETLALGYLVETAVAAHILPDRGPSVTGYLRDARGEVDFVSVPPALNSKVLPRIVEVKWSDRVFEHPGRDLRRTIEYCQRVKAQKATILTKTAVGSKEIEGVTLEFRATAEFCEQESMVKLLGAQT